MGAALIYTENDSPPEVDELVAAVLRERPGVPVLLVAPGVQRPRELPGVSQSTLIDVTSEEYEWVVVDRGRKSSSVAPALLDDMLSRPLRGVSSWTLEKGFEDYRPYARDVARLLNVFPGMPFPVRMGSQRRVCELTRHLNVHGVYTDLLVRSSSEPEHARNLLSIAPKVHAYSYSKPLLPPLPLVRRGVEKGLRRLRGMKKVAPELFSERMRVQATESAVEALRAALEGGQYDTVILNYAWSVELMRRLPPDLRASVRWVCDSHDVQFVRNETANSNEWRFGVDFEAEKYLEVEALREFDQVIAISTADAAHLSSILDPSKVILAPTGFDYALQRRSHWPSTSEGLRFGFLGGPMHANAAAVELLLDDWWPTVLRRWPEATLIIAGAVSLRRDVRDRCFLEPGVHLAGFVPSLSSYYASIDVSLSPVVVQGGLNFKSVESMMAGVLLVTTPLGTRCLGTEPPVVEAETGEGVVLELERILRSPTEGLARVQRAQRWAQQRFGNAAAYATLLESLGSG